MIPSFIGLVIHYCKDETIVGTEFYIMEFVEGRIFLDNSLPAPPPSNIRWSKLKVSSASTTGVQHSFSLSQLGFCWPNPRPSTMFCSGKGIGVAQTIPKVPKFVTVAIPGGVLASFGSRLFFAASTIFGNCPSDGCLAHCDRTKRRES